MTCRLRVFAEKRVDEWTEDMDLRINRAMSDGWKLGILKAGMPVVVVTGWRAGAGYTNTVRIIRVPEEFKKMHVMVM